MDEAVRAAEGYEAVLVPALFAQFSDPVLDAARVQDGQRVLDVACGTGVLARRAAERLGSQVAVTGVDPGLGMLTVAKRMAPGIDWVEGVAQSLPVEDDAFDAVVSQFGLMFFPERSAAICEMLRAVVPGGRLAVAVWGSIEENTAYEKSVALIDRIAGETAASPLRAPFVLGDTHELERSFVSAGATSVSVAKVRGTARFPDIRTMMEADLRGWLPLVGVELSEERISEILAAAEQELGEYTEEGGEMSFDVSANVVSAVKGA